MRSSKPVKLFVRITLAVLIGVFASLQHNPFVRLEAILGLSPSPLERIFGLKGAFSGMTEGVFQLSRGHLIQAFQANVFSFAFPLFLIIWALTGTFPRIRCPNDERIVLAALVIMSITVNIVN